MNITSSRGMEFASMLVCCNDDTPTEEVAIRCRAAAVIRDLAIDKRKLEKLPKTADGVPVVPGMEVWVWQDGELLHVHATSFDYVTDDWCLRYGMYDWCISEECYSTAAAAESARGK